MFESSVQRRSGFPFMTAALALTLVAGSLPPGTALAQDEANPGSGRPAAGQPRPSEQELLADFLHYILIDQRAVALATGTELLDRKITGAQLVKLVEESGDLKGRFESVVGRAMRSPELSEIGGRFQKLYESGLLERARNPDEIAANIKALTGPVRGKLLARQRLIAAGEYAMPQLFKAFIDNSNLTLQAEVGRLMVDLGRQAVAPLCTALPKLDAAQQEQVASILGLIPYKTSLPYLADLAATTSVEPVRAACKRAMERLGGTAADTAGLYTELAEAYYSQKPEITSFPGEEHQLLWSFNPGAGLLMTAIRTPVFHEAMAMRLTERALALKPENPTALALWVASNFKREIESPAGYANPAYVTGEGGRREAMYYAVAAGAKVDQSVLGRAIDTRNSPLARRAISAIERTAGASSLIGESADRRAIIESLTYPNKRVQYEAALAIAASHPRNAFPGSDRVVPTLAGAIREAGSQYAAVLAPDAETYQALRKILEKLNYRVLPQASTIADLSAPIAESPALDLIIVHNVAGDRVPTLVDEIRGTPKVLATPILALTSTEAYANLSRRYDNDVTIAVRQAATGEEGLTRAVNSLIDTAAGGPINDAEATDYAMRCIAALRDLAVAGNTTLNITDASTQLINAFGEAKGETKMRVAEVLARVNQDRSQRAIMDAAIAATGDDRVRLLDLAAGSAKRFGNMLESRHIPRLLEMAKAASEAEATAAAALMGALNLPNSDLMPLVLDSKE